MNLQFLKYKNLKLLELNFSDSISCVPSKTVNVLYFKNDKMIDK